MAGLVPAIHDFNFWRSLKTWTPGTSPGVTNQGSGARSRIGLRPSGTTSRRHLIACGLIGEPVPPVMMSGGPQKKNS